LAASEITNSTLSGNARQSANGQTITSGQQLQMYSLNKQHHFPHNHALKLARFTRWTRLSPRRLSQR
jgi:hypothetical protein